MEPSDDDRSPVPVRKWSRPSPLWIAIGLGTVVVVCGFGGYVGIRFLEERMVTRAMEHAQACLSSEEYAAAEKALQRAGGSDLFERERALQWIDVRIGQERYEDALGLIEQAVLHDPKNPRLLSRRGRCLCETAEWERAIEVLTPLVDVGLFDPAVVWNRGVAFLKTGRPDLAVNDFDAALALDPELHLVRRNRATALTLAGRAEEALTDLNALLEAGVDDVLVRNELGMAYFHLDEFDRAVEELRIAIERDPRSARAHGNLGRALELAGDPAGALPEYDEAIRLGSGNPSVIEFRDALRERLAVEER